MKITLQTSDDSSSSSSSTTALRKSTEGGAGWSASSLENCAIGNDEGSNPSPSAMYSTFRRAVYTLFAFFHPHRYYDWDTYERQQRKVTSKFFAPLAIG